LFAIGAAQSNRLTPWEYDQVLYRRRNEIERLFRRIKAKNEDAESHEDAVCGVFVCRR
jgi:hypothetical protein